MSFGSPRRRDFIVCSLLIMLLSVVGNLFVGWFKYNSFLTASPEKPQKKAASLKSITNGKTATQSSTLGNFSASRAIDGDINTFSHTNDDNAWLEIDMGDVYPINYVSIINRWCLGPHDPSGCLCRLSGVELSLIDDSNNVVATESIGNTCGLKEVTVEFDAKCVTATQSYQVGLSCLPIAKKVKLQSTTKKAIHVFEVRVFSPGISRDRQSGDTSATLGRNQTIQKMDGSNNASKFPVDEHSTGDKVTLKLHHPTGTDSNASIVSIRMSTPINSNDSSSDDEPSSIPHNSLQNVDMKTDVRKPAPRDHEQLDKFSSGPLIDRPQNKTKIHLNANQHTMFPTATHWEPVLLTNDMFNSEMRFFAFHFDRWAGLGSNLMNLFSQVMHLRETYNRSPIAFHGSFGYRRNSTVGLLTGFFSPRFPVLEKWGQYALVKQYSGTEENSTVWLNKYNAYRREVQKIYTQHEVFYKKMVHHSCPHLVFNDETKREMQKVRQDHGIDFDFGSPNRTSVAFHIRRTDKKREVNPSTAAEYVDRLLKVFVEMNEIPFADHCYVATDDVIAVEEIKSELKRAGVLCTVHSLQTGMVVRKDRGKFAQTLILMTELSILQEAKYFVGTFSSNIGDLVAVLRGCTHSDQTNFAHSYDVYGKDFRLF